MKTILRPIHWLSFVCLAVPLHAADGVRIAKEAGHYAIHAAVYAAQVDTNGALSSLTIAGVEFLAPPTAVRWNGLAPVLTGVFASPFNQWFNPYQLPPVQELRDNRIRCAGNGWKLEYEFFPDTIDLAWDGTPAGGMKTPIVWGRGFKAGYPAAFFNLSLAHNLQRACDPENQGELGWPVKRRHEPGNFSVLAANGAGFIVDNAMCFTVFQNQDQIPAPPHRLDLLVFCSYEATPGPVRHQLKLFRHADLAHSLTMAIQSPNRQHFFSRTNEVVFPVKVTALYGQHLNGTVTFTGSPYIWKKPALTNTVPIKLDGATTTQTVSLKIRPPAPGHYTGLISVTDGTKPLYRQRLGFMFRPEDIPPAVPPPDFDAFWDATLAELARTPLDLTLEERQDLATPAGRLFKVKYRAWGGRWAWAWLNVPRAAGKFPGKIVLPAVSVYQPEQPGPADGELRLNVAIHGGDLKDYPAQPDFDYMNTGITNRETYMLRYSYCCLARCFDILKQQQKCNGEINAFGGSQGAGLALVLAGLRPVKSATGIAVALCRIDWTVLGYTSWGPGCPPGQDPQKIAAVVRYFDPACFAHRIHAPLRLAIGLFDFCAPAEGIFTALNALPKDTPCQVFIDPYAGHFTIDATDFNQGTGLVEVPRWQGTDTENKLVR